MPPGVRSNASLCKKSEKCSNDFSVDDDGRVSAMPKCGSGATVGPPCLFPYIPVLVFPYMRPDMALNKDNAVLPTDPWRRDNKEHQVPVACGRANKDTCHRLSSGKEAAYVSTCPTGM